MESEQRQEVKQAGMPRITLQSKTGSEVTAAGVGCAITNNVLATLLAKKQP